MLTQRLLMKPQKKDTKKPKKLNITDQMRKEYELCEHDQVSYKILDKFCGQLFRRIRSDKKTFRVFADDIKHKNKRITELKKLYEVVVDKYEDKFEEYEKANEDLKKANTQLLLNVEDLKRRLFGNFERKLKDFALRPDKKKDN